MKWRPLAGLVMSVGFLILNLASPNTLWPGATSWVVMWAILVGAWAQIARERWIGR